MYQEDRVAKGVGYDTNHFPTFQTLDGMNEMSDWVRVHPVEDVVDWIDEVIKDNKMVCPPDLRTLSGVESVCIVGQYTKDLKINEGISILAKKVNWTDTQPEHVSYDADILMLIGFRRIEAFRDDLISLVQREKLKQVFLKSGSSLHRIALACLPAFDCTPQVVSIFERDIQEMEYAGICYRGLWKFDPSYASKYAELIHKMGMKDQNFPAGLLLQEAQHVLGRAIE